MREDCGAKAACEVSIIYPLASSELPDGNFVDLVRDLFILE
jgi:hypothetical protein